MEGYASDKEQVEAVKKWFKENGASLVTGVLLAATVVFGSRAWFDYQDRQALAASDNYVQLLGALQREDLAMATSFSDVISNQYSSSPYAGMAAMAMARARLEAGDMAAARAQLEWAVAHASPETLTYSARLRLARLLISEGDLDAAEAVLATTEPETYAALYEELRGDLMLARGDRAAAQRYYANALQVLPAGTLGRGLLEAKRDDLGVMDSGEMQ